MRIRAAIGTGNIPGRNGKGEQSAALAAGDRIAPYIDCEAAGLAHDFLRPGEGMDFRSASAALMGIRWLRFDLIIFGRQPVELQEPLAIFG